MGASKKTIKVVIGAFSTAGHVPGPDFAAFDVDEDLIIRMHEVQSVCQKHGLSEARIHLSPDWGPGNVHDKLSLQNGELVILSSGQFWFTDFPKHYDGEVQSRGYGLDQLRTEFELAKDGATLFLTEHDGSRDSYENAMSDAEEATLPRDR